MPRERRPPGRHDTQRQQFGDELRFWREKRGLSAAELARRIARDRRTVSAAEEGRDIPSELVVLLLEDILDTQGLLIARYESVLMEKRRLRLLRVTTTTTPSPAANALDESIFLEETVADGTLMAPGQRFTKTWTLQNVGSVPWRDRRLTRVGIASGAGLITTPLQVPITDTDPGEEVVIVVPCVAQYVEGASIASFKMTDPAGRLYFPDRYFVGVQAQVVVVRGMSPQEVPADHDRGTHDADAPPRRDNEAFPARKLT
ncbi:hypothetical protein C5C36_13880 [Rathayibacter sp. AY1G1]|uniref:NBR1-Ig-like domain-containing protein n=1 Tax=unclassified Rathayibacter TaxID=2609250 RepID=UPI000CE84271|nr:MULTISPECIES: NBR1-Ig-like domain-containing protein [unclassified Rathayibacter]PPG49570.1 hypothetical protein C5C41_15375 [Rathayibacter sp. AY1E9]PPG56480.1 hypothetical protein C5C57_14545 [Rathayibacter sp. AY1C5]PPG99825.1 hypothetical protein C5C32_10255 [Rathayibacter sp. AY1G9]PPH00290.1 hypothetical protein C5C33_17380 [Rathayibacter sp. AY1H3]PPH10649.1 hypothetical protein C5C36_13880 [Rathayibacter sp. AY1G1]